MNTKLPPGPLVPSLPSSTSASARPSAPTSTIFAVIPLDLTTSPALYFGSPFSATLFRSSSSSFSLSKGSFSNPARRSSAPCRFASVPFCDSRIALISFRRCARCSAVMSFGFNCVAFACAPAAALPSRALPPRPPMRSPPETFFKKALYSQKLFLFQFFRDLPVEQYLPRV